MDGRSRVALYLAQRIRESQRSQREIAEAVGFDNSNIITMIKQGRAKLPLERVPAMAQALEADPVHLLKLCIQEYMPQIWEAIGKHFDDALTADETSLVCHLREHVGVPYLAALTSSQLGHLQRFLESLRDSSAAVH